MTIIYVSTNKCRHYVLSWADLYRGNKGGTGNASNHGNIKLWSSSPFFLSNPAHCVVSPCQWQINDISNLGWHVKNPEAPLEPFTSINGTECNKHHDLATP